ncbi:MAG: hypothetical protein JWM46_711 [Candidatus Kaiserbacteria bacterium]|nr:hypothetical protein [Candidatus Kaiserbacteria bacterium]
MLPINYVAVLVAAVIAFIIGFLMHGPVAGKLWMRLADVHPTGNEKFSDMIPQMIWNIIVNIVTAYALAAVIVLTTGSQYLTGSLLHDAIAVSLIIWAGFLLTSTSINVIWMKASFKLWLFEAFSSLIVMLAMGATIALM